MCDPTSTMKGSISRRQLLLWGATSLGASYLTQGSGPLLAAEVDPHFFLEIIFVGGLDSLYTFDARPLALTQDKFLVNYMREEPVRLTGINGNSTWATSLVDGLRPYMDRYTVLNGVIMDPNFDGHDNNMNYLLSGNSFGGEYYLPHLNEAGPISPLDYVSLGATLFGTGVTNDSNCAALSPDSIDSMVQKLNGSFSLTAQSPMFNFLQQRMAANATGKGRFSAGSQSMARALQKIPVLSESIRGIRPLPPDASYLQKMTALMGELIRQNSCKSLQLVIDGTVMPGLNLDTHSAGVAMNSAGMIQGCMQAIADITQHLIETPYDGTRSLFDVTTLLIGTEFGRSMRSGSYPDVAYSGTDHNSLKNTFLIGGKGIRGGIIAGATDLQTSFEPISGAHRQLDAHSMKAMGRPLNFETLLPVDAKPEIYRPDDYLNFACVANTIYKLFGTPTSHYRSVERNGSPAKPLDALLI